MVLYGVVFAAFSIARHDRYNSTGFDLAFYDQVLWNTAHGRIMQFTVEGNHLTNWAFHVEPILLMIAPFKLLFADERWLLILQTLIIASGAIPVYRIAARTWKRGWAGALFGLLYLLYPTVGWANTFDIHPITFSTPLLLWAFDQLELKHFRLTSLCLLLALFCKEEMGFIVACFGLYAAFMEKWRGGWVWAAIGIAWAVFGFFVIIPSAQGNALASQAILRYEWLFRGSLAEKIAYLTGADTPVKLKFLFQLFLPLAFTSLLRPRILAIGSPAIGLSLLSANLNQSSVYHHYMMNVVPFLLIASIKGIHGLSRLKLPIHPRLAQRIVLIFCLVMTGALLVFFGPFTYIPSEPYAPIYTLQAGASLDGLRAVEPLVADQRCLTASNNIAAHYGQREALYVIGIGNYTECGRVLVDMAETRFISFGVPQDYACRLLEGGAVPVYFRDNVLLLDDSGAAVSDTRALWTVCTPYLSF